MRKRTYSYTKRHLPPRVGEGEMSDLNPSKHGEEKSHYFCVFHDKYYLGASRTFGKGSYYPECCGCNPNEDCRYKKKKGNVCCMRKKLAAHFDMRFKILKENKRLKLENKDFINALKKMLKPISPYHYYAETVLKRWGKLNDQP